MHSSRLSRRKFNTLAASSLAAPLAWATEARGAEPSETGPLETFVPCRQLTGGPLHHWFGYYDKREFDPTGRYVLANQVAFEGRSPTADDSIAVGYVDTQTASDGPAPRESAAGDVLPQWTEIGRSRAWGWQQGCMLQWVGDQGQQILWNDRDSDRFVCRIYTPSDGSVRTIDRPIYTVSPDGRFGLSVDFRRIDNLRPGYGYDGLADPNVDQRAPEDSGIWYVDLQTGASRLILSLADVAQLPWPDGNRHADAWHYFNHLLINPAGDRFIVLHRYRPKFNPETLQYQGGFVTRMLTADIDGRNRYVLDPSGHTSHFIWKNDSEVTMWTRPAGMPWGFYRFTDRTEQVVAVGHDKMPTNGHNTYLGGRYSDWILNDTYPDRTSRQTVYLYHVPSGRRVDLGHFPSPKRYRGEWRCDTHPRSSADGTQVAIDSPHRGGRQVYLLDIQEVLQTHDF